MWGISCCRCRSISVFQQVGVSVSFLSSPSRLSSFRHFPVCQAKYACHVGTQPWDTHQLLFVLVSPLSVFPLFLIFLKPTSPFTLSPMFYSFTAISKLPANLVNSCLLSFLLIQTSLCFFTGSPWPFPALFFPSFSVSNHAKCFSSSPEQQKNSMERKLV